MIEIEFMTFMGNPMDYDNLRNWVKMPYTLSDRETEAYRKFITDHGLNIDKTPFGWFFEVYYNRECQLSQREIDCLLKTVDEMEDRGIMLFPDLSTEELKAILDDMEENIDDDVGIEVIYGKIYEEYHCRISGSRILAPIPIIDYESNLVFDISYFLNDLQNDSYFFRNKKRQEEKRRLEEEE